MTELRQQLLRSLIDASAHLMTAHRQAVELGDHILAAEIRAKAMHLSADIAKAGGAHHATEAS